MQRKVNQLGLGQEKFFRADLVGTKPAMLTSRQMEILQLTAEGYANKQIGVVLSLSIKTVEKHRQEMMDRLHIHNVAILTRYAVSIGVEEPSVCPNRATPPVLRTRGGGRKRVCRRSNSWSLPVWAGTGRPQWSKS